jgi:hypothetical protein
MVGAASDLGNLQEMRLHQSRNIYFAGFHPDSELVPLIVTPTVNQGSKLVQKFNVLNLTLLNLYLL